MTLITLCVNFLIGKMFKWSLCGVKGGTPGVPSHAAKLMSLPCEEALSLSRSFIWFCIDGAWEWYSKEFTMHV